MKYLLFFATAAGLAALLTPLVILAAVRAGLVVEPRSDRWHSRATPLLGGVAIFAAYAAVVLYAVGPDSSILPALLGGALIFFLGLVDDLRGLTPQIKFIGQITVAAVLIGSGTVVEIIPYPVIAYPVTFIWIVGLTNAFNLIDNMDGLSAGIAAISSGALFVFSLLEGDGTLAVCSLVLAGACVGFLFYNFNPARIFMGDCGSMFLGFTLAALAVSGTWRHASSLLVTLLVPVLILSIPIFDTAFVTVMRKARGRPISRGGRDHLSHRLVALGFSEKKTVLMFYTLSAAVALGALFFTRINPLAFGALLLVFGVAVFYFCVYLGYAESRGTAAAQPEPALSGAARAFLVNARRFTEICADLILIIVAYFTAYLIRFEGVLSGEEIGNFIRTLPVVVVVKICVFYYFGLYQTVWRHVGVRDFVDILKSVFVSTLLVVVSILMYTRFYGFSRTLFIVDAMMTLILVSGSHFSLRVLKEYLESRPLDGRRVLIIGAGDAGEMALREIRNNPGLKFHVVGFLDDDPFKQKRRIHDVRVLGRIEDVGRASADTGACEALIAIPSLPDDGLERIESTCRRHRVACRRFLSPGAQDGPEG